MKGTLKVWNEGANLKKKLKRGLVSKETVVLHRWGRETQIVDLSTELIG